MPLPIALAEAAAFAAAAAVALMLRPWRCLDADGPPWPWVATAAVMPFLWTLDAQAGVAAMPPVSGAAMLVLLAGWPLAVLMLAPLALAAMVVGALAWDEAVHRLFWLGLLPATAMLALGAALRAWLPRDPAAYLLGRAACGTLLVCSAVALAFAAFEPAGAATDRLVAPLLVAFGESAITALWALIGVACRPRWLATWSDRLYRLPSR